MRWPFARHREVVRPGRADGWRSLSPLPTATAHNPLAAAPYLDLPTVAGATALVPVAFSSAELAEPAGSGPAAEVPPPVELVEFDDTQAASGGQDLAGIIAMLDSHVTRAPGSEYPSLGAVDAPAVPTLLRPNLAESRRRGVAVKGTPVAPPSEPAGATSSVEPAAPPVDDASPVVDAPAGNERRPVMRETPPTSEVAGVPQAPDVATAPAADRGEAAHPPSAPSRHSTPSGPFVPETVAPTAPQRPKPPLEAGAGEQADPHARTDPRAAARTDVARDDAPQRERTERATDPRAEQPPPHPQDREPDHAQARPPAQHPRAAAGGPPQLPAGTDQPPVVPSRSPASPALPVSAPEEGSSTVENATPEQPRRQTSSSAGTEEPRASSARPAEPLPALPDVSTPPVPRPAVLPPAVSPRAVFASGRFASGRFASGRLASGREGSASAWTFARRAHVHAPAPRPARGARARGCRAPVGSAAVRGLPGGGGRSAAAAIASS